MLYYSGIGSRNTPTHVIRHMRDLAFDLTHQVSPVCMRSGGAPGADEAFASGASKNKLSHMQIFAGGDHPWQEHTEARKVLDEVRHKLNIEDGDNIPPLDKMKPYVLGLLCRNMLIILGLNLKTPSEFVLAWTPGGKLDGGTRYGLKLANMRGIPVYNYGVLTDREIRTILRNKHGFKV